MDTFVHLDHIFGGERVNLELIDFIAEDGVLLNGYISKENSKKIVISVHGMSSNCFKKNKQHSY